MSKRKTALFAALGAVAATAGLAGWDLLQKRHSVLRNYPVIGHFRYFFETIRPEIHQYFVESDWDGRPFDRDTRTIIYARAKGDNDEQAFGTERKIEAPGAEYLVHSMHPHAAPKVTPRVRIGGPDCTQPYDMSLLNVSAMSFGALSHNALRALNKGAAMGNFAHDTGEGGLSSYHRENGGDLVWELGTAYFGARTPDGDFDRVQFRETSRLEQVKAISLKISQGAKPGIGGVLPSPKVTEEIARVRGVEPWVTVVSPPGHRVFSTPRELIEFLVELRELSGGKPVGFKLCVGSRVQVLSVCKAILEMGTGPDFIIVDGAEGGTGAAPLEFEDSVGMPLTDGLNIVHQALKGTGLRDHIKIGASGKIATGEDIVKRLICGADYTNSARAMMMAVGCIQAQRCNLGTCPVGVATQDPRRTRALDVEDKSLRVLRYHQATIAQALQLLASMGISDFSQLSRQMLRRKVSQTVTMSYADLYGDMEDGQLLQDPPESWRADWAAATADSFEPMFS